jgi:hypothetical protein
MRTIYTIRHYSLLTIVWGLVAGYGLLRRHFMTCPEHGLILNYDINALQYSCPWAGCDYAKANLENVTESETPSLDDLFKNIRYDVEKKLDQVTITANLPLGFTMRQFTRIYHLRDAADFKLTEGEYIELQKREMLKDLLQRIHKERFGIA